MPFPWGTMSILPPHSLSLLSALADKDPKSRLIVAEGERSDILSYMHVKPTHDEVLDCETGYLNIIAVAEAARGRGIGRLLMQAAEDWAREQDYPSLLPFLFASNEVARRFYAEADFVEDSVRLCRATWRCCSRSRVTRRR